MYDQAYVILVYAHAGGVGCCDNPYVAGYEAFLDMAFFRGVFAGIDGPFEATRYHSLVVERESLPDCLEITAWLEDGTIMGLRHKTLPIEGVQFHPESIRSEHGHAMLKNFLKMVRLPA